MCVYARPRLYAYYSIRTTATIQTIITEDDDNDDDDDDNDDSKRL